MTWYIASFSAALCMGAASGEFPHPQSRSRDAKSALRGFWLPGSSRTARVPAIKQPLALGVVSAAL